MLSRARTGGIHWEMFTGTVLEGDVHIIGGIATTAFVRNLQCDNFIQKVSKSKRKRSKSKFSHMSNVVQYGNDYSDQRNTVEESENAYENEVFDDNYSEAFTDEFFDLHKIHKGEKPFNCDQCDHYYEES